MRRCLASVGLALCGLALLAPGAGSLSAPHSGWRWSNPTPQGETLWDVQFSGRTGYAVGDFGTLLKTRDRGRTWSRVATDFYQYLDQLRVFSPRSFVVGGGCWLLRSDDGGATLHRINYAPCHPHVPFLVDISFPTERRGYLFRDQANALRTSDGGLHWEPIAQVVPILHDSAFTGPNTGVVAGEEGYGSRYPGPGLIARTTDGGGTWTQVARVQRPVWAVTFATHRVGYAVGGGVRRTLDGGRTWGKRPARIRFVNAVACSDARHCVALRESRGVFYTDDGFATVHRSAVDVPPLGVSPNALAYSSPSHPVAVGERGHTQVSADGGRSFTMLGEDNQGGIAETLRAATPRRAFSAADGVQLTLDGGRTWRHIDTPVRNRTLTATWFFAARAGYAAERRRLFVTRDGGATWSRRPRLPVEARDLWSSADGRVVVAAGHRIARSTDGGRHFRPMRQTTLPLPGAWRLQRAQGEVLFAFARSRILASSDRGAHWRSVPSPASGRAVKQLSFPTATRGYATTGDGRVWRTRNAGRRWTEVVSLGADPRLSLLSFGDADSGWIVPRDFGDLALGWMLRTDDGGRTWRPQAVGEDRISTGTLVATGPLGGITSTIVDHRFYTRTGGDRGGPSTLTLSAARPRVARGSRVRLSGVLRPARRAAEIWISERGQLGAHWTRVVTHTDARGAFHVSVPVDRPTWFVAQWTGYGSTDGAGSPAVAVDVGDR